MSAMVLLTGLLKTQRYFLDGKPLDPEPADLERDLEMGLPPLPTKEGTVKDLGTSQSTVESQRVRARRDGEFHAAALGPGRLTVKLPPQFQPGETVSVQGPHGLLELKPPPEAQPGSKIVVRLAAPAELRICIPLGKGPGSEIKIKKNDTMEIMVTVPKGLKPGDVFDVAPPALMVAVPDGAKPGDFVVFDHTEEDGRCLCRAKIPEELHFGRYFAARLPKPLGMK